MIAFDKMGTTVTVHVPGADEPSVAARVAERFEAAERCFSRFRADSELSRLNRSEGPTVVSVALFGALKRALEWSRLTGGLFEPGVGGALVALGYDRSFLPGALDRVRAEVPSAPTSGSIADLVFDEPTRTVVRPRHLHLDLGGLIKGATVDEAAEELGPCGAIDAGGDAVVRGEGPDDGPWLIDIEDPDDASRTLATVARTSGAVATSAANRRRWRNGEEVAHHLVDPRTGQSARTDLSQVTLFAERAEQADVLAKTTFLLGMRAGRDFLERQRDVGAVLMKRGRQFPIFVGELDIREVHHGSS